MTMEITCDPPCSFRIRSENEPELVSMTQQHVKSTHNMELSREDVLKTVKSVQVHSKENKRNALSSNFFSTNSAMGILVCG